MRLTIYRCERCVFECCWCEALDAFLLLIFVMQMMGHPSLLSLVWEFLFEFTIDQFYEIITCRYLVWLRRLVL